MRLRSADFRFKNVFGRKICRKSVLRSDILFTSPKVVHRPRSDSPLHFDPQNTYQIRMGKINASARRLLHAALGDQAPTNKICRRAPSSEQRPRTRSCHESERLVFPRSPARVLAACLRRQDHAYMTTDESLRFHNNILDEMPW